MKTRVLKEVTVEEHRPESLQVGDEVWRLLRYNDGLPQFELYRAVVLEHPNRPSCPMYIGKFEEVDRGIGEFSMKHMIHRYHRAKKQ